MTHELCPTPKNVPMASGLLAHKGVRWITLGWAGFLTGPRPGPALWRGVPAATARVCLDAGGVLRF